MSKKNLNMMEWALIAGKPRKGRKAFSAQEDELLRTLVGKYGENNWAEVAHHMPRRNSRQCRDRWQGYLRPTLVNSQWEPEEDQTLLQKYEEFGPKWSVIGYYIPGRSEINIKNRWKLLMQYCAMVQKPPPPQPNIQNISNTLNAPAQVCQTPLQIYQHYQQVRLNANNGSKNHSKNKTPKNNKKLFNGSKIKNNLNIESNLMNNNNHPLNGNISINPIFQKPNTIPINANPINTIPINTIPINANPINTIPINANPINTIPINANPINTNPINANPMNTNPINANSINTNSMNANSMNANSMNANSMNANSMNANPMNANPINANSINTNSINTNSINTNSINTNSMNANSINTNSINTNSMNANSINTNSINANPMNANSMNTNSINTNPMNTNPINTNPMNANPINANSINTNSINATGIQNNANNIDNSKTYISSLCNNNSLKRKQFVGHDVTVNRKQKNIIINVSPHNAPQFKHSNQQNIFTKSGISNSDSFDYHPHDVMRKDQTPHSSPDTSAADTEVINTPHDLEAFFKSLQISKLKNGRPPNI